MRRLSFDAIELTNRPWFPYLCTESEDWRWETTVSGYCNLWIVLAGSGFLTCDDQLYRLGSGMVFVFVPGQKISANHDAGDRIQRFAAHFIPKKDGHRTEDVSELPVLGLVHRDPEGLRWHTSGIMRAVLEREGGADPAAGLVNDLLCDILLPDPVLSPKLTPEVARAVRLIQRNPTLRSTSRDLASQTGMSRSHFDREFARQVGLPPRRFILARRLAEARRLLVNSQLRVGEVADSLGYTDIYFFSRQFKQHYGCSPSEYRAREEAGE